MKRYFLLLGVCLGLSHVTAEPFKEALELGAKLTNEHPGYQKGADSVNAMKYELEPEKQNVWQQNQQLSPQNLEQTATVNSKREAIGFQLLEAEKVRPRFDENVDLELLETGRKTTSNAKELIKESGNKVMAVKTTTEYVMKTCEHSRKPETFLCVRYLNNPTVDVTPAKYSNYWCSKGNHQPDDPRCSAKTYYAIPRKYKEKIVKVTPDVWVSECNAMEERRIKKECKIVKEECIDDVPRTINGEVINRPCWKYQYTYECKYPVKNDCKVLLEQGCELLNSKCKFEVYGKCYIWEQECRCPVQITSVQKDIEYVKAFCLEGDCFNNDYEPNNEMLPVISQLGIFASMQKDIRTSLNSIFKGKNLGCNKLCLSIKDCCEISGWGLGLKIAGCSDEEKELAEQRQNKLCHMIGTFCAEKMPITNICIREKTTFCCFSSKLTKLVQEQGRAQIGKGWGSAENPDCSGFTKEDLAKIDFSKLDLSEAFVDFQAKPQDLARMQEKIQQKMHKIQAENSVQARGEK